jgi:hypothetical protein
MKKSAVEWLYNNLLLNPISNEDIEYNEAVFENAKVLDAQQERSYSEEDMNQYSDYVLMCSAEKTFKLPLPPKEWFEQFKNK